RLVEMMGGTIGVESEPGRGSTFYFTACFKPVPQPAVVEETQPTDSLSLQNIVTAVGTASGGPHVALTVLLAEDNVVNQRLVMRLLEKRGHAVTLAGTGREAVARAVAERFDVILMDVQMPDLDGLQTTAQIREIEK